MSDELLSLKSSSDPVPVRMSEPLRSLLYSALTDRKLGSSLGGKVGCWGDCGGLDPEEAATGLVFLSTNAPTGESLGGGGPPAELGDKEELWLTRADAAAASDSVRL